MEKKGELYGKIINKKARVGIVGVGYVGKTLGQGASEAGYEVLGFDTASQAVERVKSMHIPRFSATVDFSKLSSCDVVCVSVPTPVDALKIPDLQPFKQAFETVATYLRPGQLITVESSIAPGTTRMVALPILEKSGLVPDIDFFLSYSPERIDPGNTIYSFRDIPKVVGGYGEYSIAIAEQFYKTMVKEVFVVSTLETAEMSKLLENTFRLVNISLMNQIADYSRSVGIDIWEVIEAAGTKPFAFMPHYPGPGVGGHCIPVDPFYLVEDAKQHGLSLSMVELAGYVNEGQPLKVVDRTMQILAQTNGHGGKKRVMLLGVTYKPDVADTRESVATVITHKLQQYGVEVSYHDPYVAEFEGLQNSALKEENVKNTDLLIIVTDHKVIPYKDLLQYGVPILDTRGLLRKEKNPLVFELHTMPPRPNGNSKLLFGRFHI